MVRNNTHTVLQSSVGELAVVLDLVLLKRLSFCIKSGNIFVKMYKFGVISICRCYCLMLLLLHCSQYYNPWIISKKQTFLSGVHIVYISPSCLDVLDYSGSKFFVLK